MEIQRLQMPINSANDKTDNKENVSKKFSMATKIKACLVSSIAQELEIESNEVNVTIPFERYGLDSSTTISIIADLENCIGREIELDLLFDYPTIETLARYLAEKDEHLKSHTAYYYELDRRKQSLKRQGNYFLETELSECSDSWVIAEDKRMLMLSSYSYLGLLNHPEINEAAKTAIDTFGTGSHGVRLTAGTTILHRQLERKMANFFNSDDAIVYNSGYVTNFSTISALVKKGDCVIGDEFNHASIVDGCHMSGAKFLTFKHNDMTSLKQQLVESGSRRTLVVVDGVYSMEGDIANLPDIVELCKQFNAMLMVDEAHSLGVLGETGRGVQEHFNLKQDAIDVKMGTLSKTIPSSGGVIAGKKEIISYLKSHARGYIFSFALSPAQVAAALKSIEIIKHEPQRVTKLQHNTQRFVNGLKSFGFDVLNTQTPIVPIMCGSEKITFDMTRLCREYGLFVTPVFYPAVPINAPRIRACVSAMHSDEDINFALNILKKSAKKIELIYA